MFALDKILEPWWTERQVCAKGAMPATHPQMFAAENSRGVRTSE
jgi:hypothetical protein